MLLAVQAHSDDIPLTCPGTVAKLVVPAGTLSEENPGQNAPSGVYELVVTAFLDSTLGDPGYDIMGFSRGPTIKVESPV